MGSGTCGVPSQARLIYASAREGVNGDARQEKGEGKRGGVKGRRIGQGTEEMSELG